MRNYAKIVVLLAACGKINAPETKAVDAALDALSCSSTDQLCAGSCVDPSMDMNNCGGCGITCTTGESCMASHCVDQVTSCADILAINGSATTGTYTLADGSAIYCDMAGSGGSAITYTGLAYGVAGSASFYGSDYSIVSLADLEDASAQQGFIALFNQQGGAVELPDFDIADCCFKFTSVNDNERLTLGGNTIAPLNAANNAEACSATGEPPLMGFSLYSFGSAAPVVFAAPLSTDFFDVYPPGATTTLCGDGGSNASNPAWYWIRLP